MILAKGHRRCMGRLAGQEVKGACNSKAQSGAFLSVVNVVKPFSVGHLGGKKMGSENGGSAFQRETGC